MAGGLVGGRMEDRASLPLVSKFLTTRRIGGAEREVTSEITKLDSPARWAVRGFDGRVRAIVDVTVEPVDGSKRSRVTIELDFEGQGVALAG